MPGYKAKGWWGGRGRQNWGSCMEGCCFNNRFIRTWNKQDFNIQYHNVLSTINSFSTSTASTENNQQQHQPLNDNDFLLLAEPFASSSFSFSSSSASPLQDEQKHFAILVRTQVWERPEVGGVPFIAGADVWLTDNLYLKWNFPFCNFSSKWRRTFSSWDSFFSLNFVYNAKSCKTSV